MIYGEKIARMELFKVIFLLCCCGVIASEKKLRTVEELIDDLLKKPRYNSRTRPSSGKSKDGEPLNVYININVNDISSISEMNMEYSMTLYLRQIWTDDRLDYRIYGFNESSITLNHNQYDRIWTPDVFIRNLKAGVFHTITVPNRLIRLSPDGTVLYSQRLTVTLTCDMELSKFPMDNQTCNIEFGSYAYSTKDLVFHWRTDAVPVELHNGINLPEYILTNSSHTVCSKKFSSTGSFPCLRAYFHLTRRLRAYIINTYLPSFLVVLLSWLSFWIDLESAPARTSLSILTILTITTQSSGLNRTMPAGSFTKAIDVWMATCLVFVFGAFIEYSIVNTLHRQAKLRAAKEAKAAAEAAAAAAMSIHLNPHHNIEETTTQKNGITDTHTPPALSRRGALFPTHQAPTMNADKEIMFQRPPPKSLWRRLREIRFGANTAYKVEKGARVFFPSAFLIFNLIYWPVYLH